MIRRGPLGAYLLLGIVLGLVPLEPGPAAETATAPGGKAPDVGTLRDVRGNRRSLRSFAGHRALVVAFLGTDCPISNLYFPTLLELEKCYRGKDVQFLAAYPNASEDLDQIAAHASDHDVPFPVLKDCGQRLADALGVGRVPAVAVLDAGLVLRYRGRIDDRYGPSFRRPKASREDLAEALEAVLAGKPVAVAETEPDGCLLDRDGARPARPGVTYSKDVARILQNHCQTCHRPDQAAPFALLTYADAVKHGRMLREVTTQRRMPPWHADPRYGHFANDRRMTSDEIDTLAAWVDSGMPRGDDRDLPAPVAWPQGWGIGKPDVVFTMPEEFAVPADGSLDYQHFTVDSGFTEDRWVRLAEARPGARGVVHHIVVYILPPGERRPFRQDGTMSVLVGWAPGDFGLSAPPDTALRVPRGSKFLIEMHYTPNGKAVKDRSSFGLVFAKKPPKYELFMNSFVNDSIRIPPRDPHYRAEATLRLPADARLISFTPHMHWRGQGYRYELVRPDGRRETLLSVPRWDFNWQSYYQFKDPVRLPKGTAVHAVAHWDNSANNPYNPDPNKEVKFGLQTWDEMMVGWVAYVWERPETAAELAAHPPSPADRFFDRLDKNGDGVLTADEIPDRVKPLLAGNGVRLPERMTREEFARLFEQMRQRRTKDKPKAEGNGPSRGPQNDSSASSSPS